MPRAFLTAEWRNLVMLNYAIEPSLLRPFVPLGTELDTWHGLTFVSLVGFLFTNTRVLGFPIPWHRTFEEVNLRFYVRRRVDGAERRAVTFIQELVPRTAVAATARLAYNEPYRALPMRHHFGGSTVEYRVEHTPWRVWQVPTPVLSGDLATVYGESMAEVLGAPPASAFLADGSPVTVFAPERLRR